MAVTANIAEGNLFMMCETLNEAALADIPAGFHIRTCRKDELDIWKAIHFDTEAAAREFKPFMDEYFEKVYAPEADKFWDNCMFICNDADEPVGTCFAWTAYGKVTTIHWYKIRREYEGRGLGRALLSHVMRSLNADEYPVFLHTHPACCRAMKLYADFGFSLITDPEVGYRRNDLEISLPYLEQMLLPDVYQALTFAAAPKTFLEAAKSTEYEQF